MEETGAAEASVMESPPSPTTAMANSGSCVVDMDRMISHDNSSELSSGEKSMVRRHSIYRVPAYIKNMTNPNAYRPQMVSLGPFHYGEAPLQPMEAHKERAVAHMVSRSGKPRQEFTAAVEKIAEELRGAYENLGEEWSGEQFVEVMVTDGCFLLEVMRTFQNYGEIEGYAPDDPVFSKHGSLYLSDCIISDMLVIENQLPFQLLQKLISVADPDNFQDDGLNNWVLYFLSSLVTSATPVNDHLGLHPLDVLHKSVTGTHRHQKKPITFSFMPCAAELHEAGIHFKLSAENGFGGGVTFEGGVVNIPMIFLFSDAERIFLNLMAFERLHPGAGNDVTAFVFFMDLLIDTTKDVALLRSQGIIKNGLGSDEAVVDLIKKTLTKHAVLSVESSLSSVIKEVNSHYKNPWNKWRVKFRRTYFSNPWLFSPALILFVATIIQTIYTVLSFYNQR